jgi:ABC-type phosphate/phosphonate transport system substrate-binding protein
MHSCSPPARRRPGGSILSALGLSVLLLIPGALAYGQGKKLEVLHIGSSNLMTGVSGPREKAAMETLRTFIKEETGLNNEILPQSNWQQLSDTMAKGELQLGVFEGYEFSWAVEKQPKLKPLAIAVNVYRYPVAYVVVARDNKAKDFADLKGQSLAIPATGQGFLRLFIDRQCTLYGEKTDKFFSKIATPENVEDALDEVVDGKVQAVVIDRAALEAYKQRKPGRFNRLKQIIHSQPFPPAVVAYYDDTLDQATLQRFKAGLLDAAKKEKGEMLLTLFRLTGFGSVPSDFAKVLAETRKAYPPTPSTASAK